MNVLGWLSGTLERELPQLVEPYQGVAPFTAVDAVVVGFIAWGLIMAVHVVTGWPFPWERREDEDGRR